MNLIQLLRDKKIEEAKSAIASGANVNIKGENGETPLHIVAFLGDVELARALIAAGADIEAECSSHRETPLHWAARYRSLGIVRLLIDAGANVNAVTRTNWTPLQYATSFGESSIAEALLLYEHGARPKKGPVKYGDNLGLAVLNYVGCFGDSNEDYLRKLLESLNFIKAMGPIVDVDAAINDVKARLLIITGGKAAEYLN